MKKAEKLALAQRSLKACQDELYYLRTNNFEDRRIRDIEMMVGQYLDEVWALQPKKEK